MKLFQYLYLATFLNASNGFGSELISFVINNGASVILSDAFLNLNDSGLKFVDIKSNEQIASASCRVTYFHPDRESAPARNSNNRITCNIQKSNNEPASIEFSLAEIPMEWFGSVGRPPAISFTTPLSDQFYAAFEASAKLNRVKAFQNFRRRFDYTDEMSQTSVRSWGVALGENISRSNGDDEIFPVFLDCVKFSQAEKVTKSFCSITAF